MVTPYARVVNQNQYSDPFLVHRPVNKGRLTLDDLGELVRSERLRRGMSLRDTASATGIPFNTLARVEKGHVPDLPKFKRLVEWCGLDIHLFFEPHERPATTIDLIAEHLKADSNLPDEAAEKMSGIISELYRALAQPKEIDAAHLRAAKTFRPEASRALGEMLNDMNQVLTAKMPDAPPKRL